MDAFTYFVLEVFPPVILVVGISGDLIGIVTMASIKLKKLSVRNIYIYLLIFDLLYLLQLIILFMQFGIGGVYDYPDASITFCKIFNFLNYSMATISPSLIIYISVERYISARYPSKRFIFGKNKTQMLYLLAVCVYLTAFYLAYPFFYDLIPYTAGNTTTYSCSFDSSSSQIVLSFLFLVNSAILPFIIMFAITVLLVNVITKSRHRIAANHTAEENKTFKRDFKFTVTSISLNLMFIILNLPVSIAIFFPNYQASIIFVFCYYLFYSSYGINFYVLLAFNSIIWQNFLTAFRLKRFSKFNSYNNTTHEAVRPTRSVRND